MATTQPTPTPARVRTRVRIDVRTTILWLILLGFFLFLANAFIQDPSLFLRQVINGLAQGAIFALVALGYTMVYGIIELINFAHGDVYMVGAFTSLTIASLMRADESTGPLYNFVTVLLMFLSSSGLSLGTMCL